MSTGAMSATPDDSEVGMNGAGEPVPHHPEDLVPGTRPSMEGEPGGRAARAYPDKDPAPAFSGHSDEYTYKQWKRDLALWRSGTRLLPEQQGPSVLRQLRGEARAAADVVSNERLTSASGLEFIVIELDRAFGPFEGMELFKSSAAVRREEIKKSKSRSPINKKKRGETETPES